MTHDEWMAEKAEKDWWLPWLLEWAGDHLIILAYRVRGMVE